MMEYYEGYQEASGEVDQRPKKQIWREIRPESAFERPKV